MKHLIDNARWIFCGYFMSMSINAMDDLRHPHWVGIFLFAFTAGCFYRSAVMKDSAHKPEGGK
jgi:hypothetical protein